MQRNPLFKMGSYQLLLFRMVQKSGEKETPGMYNTIANNGICLSNINWCWIFFHQQYQLLSTWSVLPLTTCTWFFPVVGCLKKYFATFHHLRCWETSGWWSRENWNLEFWAIPIIPKTRSPNPRTEVDMNKLSPIFARGRVSLCLPHCLQLKDCQNEKWWETMFL